METTVYLPIEVSVDCWNGEPQPTGDSAMLEWEDE